MQKMFISSHSAPFKTLLRHQSRKLTQGFLWCPNVSCNSSSSSAFIPRLWSQARLRCRLQSQSTGNPHIISQLVIQRAPFLFRYLSSTEETYMPNWLLKCRGNGLQGFRFHQNCYLAFHYSKNTPVFPPPWATKKADSIKIEMLEVLNEAVREDS